jgi:hypothetical protein
VATCVTQKERSILLRKIATTYERQGEYDLALQCLAGAADRPGKHLPVESAEIFNEIARNSGVQPGAAEECLKQAGAR